MLLYNCYEEKRLHPDEGIYTAYGLVVNQKGTALYSIPDITTNKERLERLAVLCNRLQPHPLHLPDIIEDFIG